MLIFLVTPTLGLIKNFVKYKRVSGSLFLRTPIISCGIYLLIRNYTENAVLKTIVAERWLMFVFKIGQSYINDDYNTKKEKYIKKYSLTYKK